MDVLTPTQRSYNMSCIRSTNTAVELMVFKALRREKVYFQKHYNRVPGKPDIALPRKKRAVFIDGNFWHGYNFKVLEGRLTPFWKTKIRNNIIRDRRNRRLLKKMGWSVLRIWDHELEKDFEPTIAKIQTFLASE